MPIESWERRAVVEGTQLYSKPRTLPDGAEAGGACGRISPGTIDAACARIAKGCTIATKQTTGTAPVSSSKSAGFLKPLERLVLARKIRSTRRSAREP